jgi:beta-phosphoglucomutase family hydrolase
MNSPIAFIFDMDGTMIDNMTFHVQAWQEFLTSLGIAMTPEELDRHNRGTIAEVLRQICGEHLTDAEVIELGDRKEWLYREFYRPHLKLIPGLLSFLDQAKHLGIPMALATSAGKANIDFVLDGLNIRSYFDACVGGHEVKFGKPHPETFLKAAQRLNCSPMHCLVFEDTLSGIEAAQNAGMNAIAITTTLPSQAFAECAIVQQTIQNFVDLQPAMLLKQKV